MIRRILIASVLVGCVVLQAEDKTLSADDRKDLMLSAQSVEIWRLNVANAALQYEKAQTAYFQLRAAKTPAGYILNDKFELEPIKKAETQ